MNISEYSNYKPNISYTETGVIANDSSTLLEVSRWYFLVINIIFIPPTVFGNTLILVSLTRFKSLRSVRAYILVGNLAVSDLLVGLISMPMDVVFVLSTFASSSKTFCLWYFSLLFTSIGLSVVNLFLLSLERFHAIASPIKHKLRFTKRRIFIMITLTWIAILFVGFLPLFGINKKLEGDFVCKKKSILTPTYINIVITILLSSIFMNAIFFFIIVRIATKTMHRQVLRKSLQHEKRLKKEIRHTRNMLIITGLFILFWGPFCIAILIPGDSTILLFVKQLLSSLGLINSCLNWIVYGVRCKKFRTAFRSILTCRCTQREFKLPPTSS
ncbi:5-hydroxytryptamine receptor-like [Mercenaria mercenaria]|uniref:5-hydroxytryptamine receptor-like n=1 Tax=Mercenaria mercenaria TaxID=6596 RepID=UPI00234F63D2|nr:5-hydroxytryptamine receptor-like [Mercenaria mercenaria]